MGKLDHVELELIDTIDKAWDFKNWLGERRSLMGVDTETSGFNFIDNRLRLVQFGDLNKGWAIPFESWGGVAREALLAYKGDIVLHNSPFDIKFLVRNINSLRWDWSRTWDTMTMAHLDNPNRPKGLKPLAAMYVDGKAVAAQRTLSEGMATNKWTWGTVPIEYPPYWIYSALDPVLTCHIYEHLKDRVPAAPLDLEMGALKVLTDMMTRGIRVDVEYCVSTQRELINSAQQLRNELREEFKIDNATSNPQVLAALRAEGVDIPGKKTKSGGQALDKEVLSLIDHPIARKVEKLKNWERSANTYFKNFVEMVDHDDRLHATIWGVGAKTGRMSISDPSLQNVPKKEGLVRNAFIPSEGNYLVSIDADQIEARLMAHFSQDNGLREAFLGGDDFFVNIARHVYSDPTIEKADPRRQLIKGQVYGKLYGAGIETMARTTGVTPEVMQEADNQFNRSFPGVRQFQNQVNNAIRNRYVNDGFGWVKTPVGRRLIVDDNAEYTGINYLIQGHAAEVFKQNLIKLDASGFGDYLTLPVHDEIVLDVPADLADEVCHAAEDVMNDPDSYFVPITWSGEIIKERWGQKYGG